MLHSSCIYPQFQKVQVDVAVDKRGGTSWLSGLLKAVKYGFGHEIGLYKIKIVMIVYIWIYR